MAKNTYVGVNNVARKCKSIYVGVNGVARKIKKVYVGVNGVAKQCYDSNTGPLNTDKLTLGQHDVYFIAYPDLKWCVDHLDGNYVYLGLYNCTEKTQFNPSAGQVTYIGSILASKCTEFLNGTIPNVANYLENVTVNGVTNKVFVPSYKMFSSSTGYDGMDRNDPIFKWPSALAANRKACVSNWSAINNFIWLSSPANSSTVWNVNNNGKIGASSPVGSYGFRPEVKVKYK